MLKWFRDNPDTDIYGGNLYKEEMKKVTGDKLSMVEDVTSILVSTGVYSKGNRESLVEMPDHLHKDIKFQPNMRRPDHNVENITDAVKLIIEHETW